MARLVTTLTLDTSGLARMSRMTASLGEALSVANANGEIDFVVNKDGVSSNGAQIVMLRLIGPKDGTFFANAIPTFRMPLFAEDVRRVVPGIKVRWEGGWPIFSASDGSDPEEDEPDPAAPDALPLLVPA